MDNMPQAPGAMPSAGMPSPAQVLITPPKYKKIGLALLIFSAIGLPAILVVWAVASFIISRTVSLTGGDNYEATLATARSLNVVLGFLGFFAVLAMPASLIFLLRRVPDDASKYDPRSGKGALSQIPPEIKGWNWGAAFLNVIWGFYHRVWWSLLIFVPFVNWIWWIIMGVFGSEWAWKAQPWQNVDAFKASQRPWKTWGIIAFVFSIIMMFMVFIGPILLLGSAARGY